MGSVSGGIGIGSLPISGGSNVTNIFRTDFTATFGAVATLVGAIGTTSISGLLTTDAVSVQCLGSMPAGCNISNARVSASGVLELTFTTAIVAGVSLGSLSYRVTVVR